MLQWVREFSVAEMHLVHGHPLLIPCVILIIYLLGLYTSQRAMKSRRAVDISGVLQAWNFLLAAVSLVLFLGIAPQTLKVAFDSGVYELVCMPHGELYVGPQLFFSYVFCFVKYVEMVDTFLLILRKRPISLLHLYHHVTVPAFSWFCMLALPGGAAFFFAVLNAAVHTFKYWWYYCSASGRHPTWGQVVTMAQLVQMVLGLVASILWAFYYFKGSSCHGSYPLCFLVLSAVLYGSYFLLFLLFYVNRYALRRKSASMRRKERRRVGSRPVQ